MWEYKIGISHNFQLVRRGTAKHTRTSAKWLGETYFDIYVIPVTVFSVLCSQGSQMSDVTTKELHSQAQEQLQHYFMGRALEERAQQHREALTAQISTNIEQLMSTFLFHFSFLRGTTHMIFCDIQNL